MKLKYDPDLVDYAMFVGDETEGPRKGEPTFFVVGTPPIDRVLIEYDKLRSDHQVYLGAGGWHTFDLATAEKLLRQGVRVTIETPDVEAVSLDYMSWHTNLLWIVPLYWGGVRNDEVYQWLNMVLTNKDKVGYSVLHRLAIKYDYGDVVHTTLACHMTPSVRSEYERDQELLVVQKENQ